MKENKDNLSLKSSFVAQKAKKQTQNDIAAKPAVKETPAPIVVEPAPVIVVKSAIPDIVETVVPNTSTQSVAEPALSSIISLPTQQVAPAPTVKEQADALPALQNDIMNNKFFKLSSAEAKSIARKMIARGPVAMEELRWFLTETERRGLANELTKKYNL